MIEINEQQARDAIKALEAQFEELVENARMRQQAAQQIPTLVAKANQCQGAIGVWRALLGEQEQEQDDDGSDVQSAD